MKKSSGKVFFTLVVFVIICMMTNIMYVFAENQWTTVRNGFDNIGTTDLSGSMTSVPDIAWSQYIRGSALGFTEYDWNNDGYKDLMYLLDGKITVIDRNKTQLWQSAINNITCIIGYYDIDNDGIDEIATIQGRSVLCIVSKSTGNSIWSYDFNTGSSQSFVNGGDKVIIHDLNGDGYKEIFVYLYNSYTVYCYSFDTGIANGYLSWSKTDNRDYSHGGWGGFPPEFALTDFDGNGTKEISMANYGGIEWWDPATGNIPASPVQTSTNWAASANGGTASSSSNLSGYSAAGINNEVYDTDNDADNGSYWVSDNETPAWCRVDFSTAKDIKYVFLRGTNQISELNVQTWDGSQFVTLL